jgi:23S rRNA (adenine2503-C2)-methyltransferase
MKVVASVGKEDIALVYVGEFEDGKCVEFVEALSPPKSRDEKWVLLVSTLYGCPVGCQMCDAGGYYHGKVSKEDLFAQIDYLIRRRYPDGVVPAEQLKIQFARMGEPAFNPAVLEVLDEFPRRYDAPGFMPSISTIAPLGSDDFLERLMVIKRELYSGGNFQMQFSIHTTDDALRDQVIPVKKWDFARIAEYSARFYEAGDRKVTLNFALAEDMPVDPDVLTSYFDPQMFLIKITPLNPTHKARDNELTSYIDASRDDDRYDLVEALRDVGYQVIVSIGEPEENYIGSNCGQYVLKHLDAVGQIPNGYTYPLNEIGTQS